MVSAGYLKSMIERSDGLSSVVCCVHQAHPQSGRRLLADTGQSKIKSVNQTEESCDEMHPERDVILLEVKSTLLS